MGTISAAYDARSLLSPSATPASELFSRPLRENVFATMAELLDRTLNGPDEPLTQCVLGLLLADRYPCDLTRTILFRDLQLLLSTESRRTPYGDGSSRNALFRAILLTLQYVSIERYPTVVLEVPATRPVRFPIASGGGGAAVINVTTSLTLYLNENSAQLCCDGNTIGLLSNRVWAFSPHVQRIYSDKDTPTIHSTFYLPWVDAKLLALRDAQALLSQCFEHLTIVWPEALADIRWLCARIIPLALVEESAPWRSSSCRDEPFSIYATLSALSIRESCEGILHESMHLRFHLIESLGPLIKLECNEMRYFHAWRREPRPPTGVLMAAHAFFNIWHFYRKHQFSAYASEKPSSTDCNAVKKKVQSALSTLLFSNSLTPLGEILVSQMITDLHQDYVY